MNISKEKLQTLVERAALNIPPYEDPKPIDTSDMKWGSPLIVGWWFNEHRPEAGLGCTNGASHSHSSTEKTNSRGPGRFYHTKLEATRAMRWAVTRKVMRQLADFDKMVEEAEK